MQRLRFDIRTKVLLLFGGLLLVIFSGLALVFVRNTVHSLRQSLTSQATSFAELATQPIGKTFLIYKDSGTVRIDQQVEQFSRLNNTVTNIAVYDLNGKTQYMQHKQPIVNISAQQASTFDRQYITGSQGELTAVLQPFIEDSGVHQYGILYTISNAQIQQSIRKGVLAIIGFAVFALLLVGGVLFIAMNQLFLKPVRRVSQAALAISAGNLDVEIPEERHDEIGDLAQSVNTMADSLKADITKLQEVDKLKSEFMTITSHNLRTPLTIINGFLETLKTMQLPANVTKMVDTISANSAKLSNLAEDILTISELEAGHKLTGAIEVIDLLALTNEIAAKAKELATQQNLNFTYKAPASSISARAPKHHLKVAIMNLLDNALKFTKAPGQVTLELSTNGTDAIIKVSDNGIGIAAEELPKLFTKFHRGTSVMEYNYEGTGIGLYISRLLVRDFGGDINAESQQGKGSTFTITLPLDTRNSQRIL